MASGIDGILAFFEEHSVIGMMNLQPHSEWLIYTLAVLDLALTYGLTPDTTRLRECLNKFLRYGFFLFVIRNFQDVSDMLFKTFASAGSIAASGNNSAVALTPGAIWDKGFATVEKLFGQVFSMTIFDSFGNWFVLLLAICFIAIATFKMVYHFLEMKIEFCIFSSIAVFFIPFTCLKQLNFLFQRIITGFFSSLTKIMVMYFMLALVQSEITKFTLAVDNKASLDLVNQTLRFLVMGLIVCKLPQFAANIMTGSPAMGGSMSSFATGAVGGAATAVIGGTGFASGAMQQYKDRIAGGATMGQAALGTAGAVMKDIGNAALGDPANKVWFPAYDRGHSQTLRRKTPFEK